MPTVTPIDTAALPVPTGDYPVTPEQVAAFVRDGHVTLRGVASPAAPAEIAAWEAHQIAQLYRDYRDGRVDYRTFVRQASRVGGGALGALGGAAGGAVAGMWIGTFGGPVAWFTIPAGFFIGGAAGSLIGYLAGSTIAGTAADWYFTSLDAESQRHLGEKLLVLSWSELDQLRGETLR